MAYSLTQHVVVVKTTCSYVAENDVCSLESDDIEDSQNVLFSVDFHSQNAMSVLSLDGHCKGSNGM